MYLIYRAGYRNMTCSSRSPRGATLTQVLLLILFLFLLAGFFYFKELYGVTGTVKSLPVSTVDRIAFVRQDGKYTNLFLAAADGSDFRQLTDDATNKRSPAWSPDGRQIVYAAEPQTGEEGK